MSYANYAYQLTAGYLLNGVIFTSGELAVVICMAPVPVLTSDSFDTRFCLHICPG